MVLYFTVSFIEAALINLIEGIFQMQKSLHNEERQKALLKIQRTT